MTQPDPYAARRQHFGLAGGGGSLGAIIAGLLVADAALFLAAMLLTDAGGDGIHGTLETLAAHLIFLAIPGALWLFVRRVGRRNPLTVIGDIDTAKSQLVAVARAVLILLAVFYLMPGNDWSGVEQALPILPWLILLPVTCAAVLIQTGAEEFLYRGYLQQSLGARYDTPWAWMVAPSVLFGLSHFSADAPWDATLMHMIWTTALGLAAADLTARTGNIGAAVGLHFAHNLPLLALVATPGDYSGVALLHASAADGEAGEFSTIALAFQLFYLWMLWMAARIAIRR